MIVPRSRLLWFAGVALISIAALQAIFPASAELLWQLAALLALVAVFDAVWSGGDLRKISVTGEQPTRLTKGTDGTIDLKVSAELSRGRLVHIGLPMPRHLGCVDDEFDVALPAGRAEAVVPFACLPRRRGPVTLDRCCIGARSPLGLWTRRIEVPLEAQVRVYPRLAEERKRLASVFLYRGNFGIHVHRQIGRGREFEQLREYVPGDDYNEIHWKASGKRGRPITKMYQIERTQEVYMVIDSSRLSARLPQLQPDRPDDTVPPNMLERFITATMIMAMVTRQQGDLFGAISFSDRVTNFIRAKSGKAHYGLCRDAIYAIEPTTHTPDFSEIFSFIRLNLRRRALLVFLTCLDDPIIAESFAENIHLITRKHLVLVNMIQPPGVGPLFGDPDVRSVEDIYHQLGGHMQWQRLSKVEAGLARLGVPFRILTDEGFCPQLVSQYVNIKQRQAL